MGGKTKLQMRAELRTDLKDSGSLWSDAELNLSVDKAYADLSRMLPLEKVYEESLQFTVTSESVTFPADTDVDRIVDAVTLNGVSAGDTLTITAQPDVPRHLTFLLTDADASVTNFTIIVKGTDEDDKAIEESFHFGGGLAQTGKKIFKSVREVELDQVAGTAAAGDVVDIGIGAYTDTWVHLTYKPIKSVTSVADSASTTCTEDTDYRMDYANGRIKAISGGYIAAAEACTITYTKSQIQLDLDSLADLIRVEQVEYPTGDIPQSFVPVDIWGNIIRVTGAGENAMQGNMAEDKHIAVYYAAEHQPPTDYSPGTAPEFLYATILVAAGGYALFIYALKCEHQAVTDLTAARTALTAANTAHTALGAALTNVKKYLDNNSDADAVGILEDVTTDAASLRTAIAAALDAANTYLDAVATDLTNADTVAASYIGATDLVAGATEPSIKAYLTSGDALITSINDAAEGTGVPETYRGFAQTTNDALVRAYEQHRQFYLDDANARALAGYYYTQEAAQRLSNLNSYITQAEGYTAIASIFVREAEARVAEVQQYLTQADGYITTATNDMTLADRFRAEANERRSEAWNVWRDRKQYIGDFTQSAPRQLPRYD